MMAGCHGIFEGSASSWKFCFAGTWRLVLLSNLNLSCVLLSRMCLLWTWLCRLWTWLCRLWTWLSCESKTCLCRLLYALSHMNMLYMQKFLSPVNCMCIDSETGNRHMVHLEATTCRNLNQTRGPTKNEKVAQPKMTRGQTAARHVDKPECDTWTIQSSTRGQTAARHVVLCQRAASSYPCQHAHCHVSSQHGLCHVASPSVTNFVTIWLSHRRNTLLWRKTCWSWKSSTSMTKMTNCSW
jgi:hypothetical protein